MHKKIIYIVCLFFLLFSNCTSKNSSENTEVKNEKYNNYDFKSGEKEINIGTQPLYLPTGIFVEALKRDVILNKELKALGYTLNYYPFLKGNDVNNYLENNKIQIGIGGDMPVLMAAASMDIIIPIRIQNGNCAIVVNKSKKNKKLERIKFAYPFGSISHYLLSNLLLSNNINPNDAKIYKYEINDLIPAINSGEIDAFSGWEPTVTKALKENENLEIMTKGISTGYLYFKKDYYEKNTAAVKLIVTAFVRALNNSKNNEWFVQLCNYNLFSINNFTNEIFQISNLEILELAKNDIFQLSNMFIINEKEHSQNSRLYYEFSFLKNLNLISDNASWNRIQNSFNHEIIYDILKNPAIYKINSFNYKKLNQQNAKNKN